MFQTLLVKEFREQWRTWKVIILLAVFLITGFVSPVLAKYTPALLRSIPGVPAELAAIIPEPSLADAVTQYVKNLSQFGILLVIILNMGAVAQEKERNTAAMLLTKPVQRSSVILAKWLSSTCIIIAGVAISGIGCAAYTALLFDFLPIGAFVTLNLLFMIYLIVYLSVALLASTLARTQAMAAAGAFGGLVVLLLLGSLPRISDYTPGRLINWGSSLVEGGHAAAWPALGITVGIIALAILFACFHFEREEI